MRRRDVKTIIAYFYGIPAMRAELAVERAELEDEYNGLRGTSYDGVPHSSTPGKPVEELAERVDAGNVWGKLETVAVRVHVLEADREKIQDCLNAINGEYTRLIFYRYRDKYSWVKIGVKLGITERTAKRWGERALDRLGEALEEVSMPDEILSRASRARLEVSGAGFVVRRQGCFASPVGTGQTFGGRREQALILNFGPGPICAYCDDFPAPKISAGKTICE